MNQLTNPLGLIYRIVRETDTEFDDVVILTFNHDLAFFERVALGPLQTLHSRITIVGDARMSHHDLYGVRRAGHSYLPGLAVTAGAFHPKVLVFAGEDRAVVAVGSGNLSMAGWQGNDELWSIHQADQTHGGSAVISQVAEWLIALVETVKLSEGTASALQRVGARLERFECRNDEASFVHSLQRPILNQLPIGPVDHLRLYAPFQDDGALAIRQLIDRFQPRHLQVALQPSLTHFNPQQLSAQLPDGAEVLVLAEDRYRHGKLIEWELNGSISALTGSPNLSLAALTRTVQDGGNVEVGVIAPVASSLMPEPERKVSAAATAEFELPRVDSKRTKADVVVLSAVLAAGGTAIELASPLPGPGVLEVSLVGMSPDDWNAVCVVNKGELLLAAERLRASSRVRVRLEDGRVSTVAFVIDPDRIIRTGSQSRVIQTWELEEVFEDPTAGERFFQLLSSLPRVEMSKAGRPSGGSSTVGVSEAEDWRDYLDRCRQSLGPAALSFALGLPLTIPDSDDGHRDIDWDEETPEDIVGALDDDEPDDSEPSAPLPAKRSAWTERERERYRRMAAQMCAQWPTMDLVRHLLAIRCVLNLAAAGAWDRHDHTWAELALGATRQLGEADVPSEMEEAAGSLAATVLSVTRQTLRDNGLSTMQRRYQQCSEAVAHLLVAGDDQHIAEYGRELQRRFGALSEPAMILELVERIIEQDLIGDAVADLAEDGFGVERHGSVLRIRKDAQEPLLIALQALCHAERNDLVGIVATGTTGWALVMWKKPDLIVVLPGKAPGSVMCRHYRFRARELPGDEIRITKTVNPSRHVDQSIAGQVPLPIAVDLAAELGIAIPPDLD